MKITNLAAAWILSVFGFALTSLYAQDYLEHGSSNIQFASSNFSIAESLKELQEQVEANDEAIGELKDDIKGKVSPGSSAATMKIAGRVHVDYWGFPSVDEQVKQIEGGEGPQARLNFRRMRFGVRGDLPSNMEYRIEMEFAGGNNSEFRDAWLGFKDLPFFQKVLIGNQKRPYGYDHLNSSRFNIFIERPFVIESFNQDARRLGIQSYGVSEDQAWNWRYGVFNQRLIQDEGNYTNNDLQLEVAGRLANTFWYDEASGGRGYGHWAISGTHASPDGDVDGDNGGTGPDQNEARFRHRPEARTANRWLDTGRIAGAEEYQLLGLESVLNFGALQFAGEYQQVWMNRENASDLSFHGYYATVSYFLTGEHMPWKRSAGTLDRIKPHENFFLVRTADGSIERGLGAWQLALRYSYADFNDQDITGGIGESLTAGLNWYWTPNARMQFNWINGSIENNNGRSGDYDIAGARFMVDF